MPADTVLLCCTASVGEYAITRIPITSNQQFNGLVIKSEFKDKLSADFLFNVASTLKEKLKAFCGKTSVDFVSGSNLKSIQIPLPPLAEQRKIAEILRTWDEAIETAEAELKAKQERKRWLMDKLFGLGAAGLSKLGSSDWPVHRLGDILEIHHGKNQREVESAEGRYPILGTGGVIGHTNAFLYDKPSVLIGRKGTIDRPQYMDTPFWTIDTLFYTSISDRAIPRFIFYVFCTINWQQYNAATGVPSLAASTIESIKIQLPPLAEQRRIADILQAVDADAEVINCRIENLRAQKRGLMQKLLTGEVRVNP
jgi:type I restriction enzyme S subunit